MSGEKIIDFQQKKNEKFVREATEKFRRDLPKLVETRRQEAANVGECFPTFEKLLDWLKNSE